MKKNVIAVSIALASAQPFAHAQETELAGIRVSARPIIEDNRVDPFSSVATVVGEEQLRDLNAVDLAAALRHTPGVQISRFNPVGAFGGDEGGAVLVRGLGASRPGAEIKTYIDGVPFYMGVWNHPLLDLLPLNGMRSITVHKSPQPQVSGNNFVSIDLQTRRATEEGVHGGASISGGSFGTLIEHADLTGRSGDLDFMLAQGYARSHGHRDNAEGELKNLMGRIGYRLNANWSVDAMFLHTDNKARDPGDERLPKPAIAPRYDTRGTLLSASLAHRHGDWTGELKAYSTKTEGDWLDQPGDTRTDSKTSGVRWRETFSPWLGATLVAGLDHDRIEGDVDFAFPGGGGNAFDVPDFRITSPYAALSQRVELGGGWALVPSAGLRHYSHNKFDSKTAPHAGLSLVSDALTVFANLSRGINYPGPEVAVLSNLIPPLGLSWRGLGAEDLRHVEVGVKFTPSSATTVDLSVFRDEVKNRYIFGFPPEVPPPPQFINLGEYRMRGAELALRQDIGRDWRAFAGVTLLDPSIDNLPFAPRRAATVGVNGRVGALSVAVDAQYQSAFWALNRARAAGALNTERLGAFTVVNARIGYTLPILGKGGEVFIAGENLFDRDYAYRPGYPMPGRSGQIGIAARF